MYGKFRGGEITSIQAFVMLISIMIGTGVLGLSREVAEVSKQDAWLSVLLNGLFISLVMAAIIFIASKFPKYNFLQYVSCIMGKPLGYLITICFLVYAVMVTATITRLLGEMVTTWLLPKTPLYIINFLVVVTSVYMIRNGLTVLARFNEVIIFMLIPFALLILVGIPQIKLINLRPIGGTGIITIFKGILPSFYSFAGYEVLLIYYNYISDKQKPILRNSVLGIAVVTIFYAITVASQIAMFGAEEISHVLYPSISYLTSVDFPVLERMEIFFVTFWIFTVMGTVGIQYMAACILLQNIFNNKKISLFAYGLSPVIYILSVYPENIKQVFDIGGIVGKLNIFFGLILPLILILIYSLRRKKNYEKSN